MTNHVIRSWRNTKILREWQFFCFRRQFVPRTSISRQFVSKHLTILRLIQVLPVWIDDHPGKGLKLCTMAPLSCYPIRSIAQRIFEHVPPCRRTTLLFVREVFATNGNFSVAPAEITWFKHLCIFFNKNFIRCAFTLSTSQVHMVKKWCWFVKICIFSSNSSTWEPYFCFLPAIFDIIHVHWQKWPSFPMSEHTFPISNFSPSKFQWSFFELSLP